MRGEGGVLKSLDGVEFMDAYHPLKSLAPRDVVARAIDSEMKKSGAEHVLAGHHAQTGAVHHRTLSEHLPDVPALRH